MYLNSAQRYQGFHVKLWQWFDKDLGATIEHGPITAQSRIGSSLSGAVDVVSGGGADGAAVLVRKVLGVKGM